MSDNRKLIEAINRHLTGLTTNQLSIVLRLLYEFEKANNRKEAQNG